MNPSSKIQLHHWLFDQFIRIVAVYLLVIWAFSSFNDGIGEISASFSPSATHAELASGVAWLVLSLLLLVAAALAWRYLSPRRVHQLLDLETEV